MARTATANMQKMIFLALMERSTSLYGMNVRRPFHFIASLFPFMLFMLTFNPAFTFEVVIDFEKVTIGFL